MQPEDVKHMNIVFKNQRNKMSVFDLVCKKRTRQAAADVADVVHFRAETKEED